MKKNLLLFLLFITGALSAQVVNIPDANFKFWLINAGVDTNADGEIQVFEAQAVETLFLYDGSTSSIASLTGIEAFTNLTGLDASLQQLSSVDLSVLPQLTNLTLDGINVTSLNLDGLNLTSIYFIQIDIDTLDLSAMTNLTNLKIESAPYLTSLNLGYNTNFAEIEIHGSALSYADLSGCPNLSDVFLSIYNNTQDAYVNLKNGNTSAADMYIEHSSMEGYNCFVCIDEGDEVSVNPVDSYIYLSSYCNFTPGGNYNSITGNLTFDADNNGCSATDVIMPFSWVEIHDVTETGYAISSTGNYAFYTQAGTYTLTPQFENDWFTASPATVTFADNDNNVTIQNFCVTANGVHNDVDVLIAPLAPAKPGFDAVYTIVYTNKGNQTLSGDVMFTYDDTVLDYVNASPVEASSATGSLTWSYSNLLPFESREIIVTLNVNGPMETPAVNINDELEFSATITPSTGDESPWDNTFSFNEVVVGSYDPNDITCLEGETISPNYIGEYLHYNINFENTGTAPATFIVVKDVIDETQFDISTLQLINASHDVEARITGNKVEFYFDDINLAANGGKGNVVFKIKTLESVEVNSSVTQQAEIFFDYNWPIVTNEATITFFVLNSSVFDKDNTIAVSPNPATNVVNITSGSELKRVELYDVQGRLLQSVPANGLKTALDISNRAAGIYFLKISTEKGAGIQKVIKM